MVYFSTLVSSDKRRDAIILSLTINDFTETLKLSYDEHIKRFGRNTGRRISKEMFVECCFSGSISGLHWLSQAKQTKSLHYVVIHFFLSKL